MLAENTPLKDTSHLLCYSFLTLLLIAESFPGSDWRSKSPLRIVLRLKSLAEILLRQTVLVADCPVCVGWRMTGADCSTPSDRKRAFLSRQRGGFQIGNVGGGGGGGLKLTLCVFKVSLLCRSFRGFPQLCHVKDPLSSEHNNTKAHTDTTEQM